METIQDDPSTKIKIDLGIQMIAIGGTELSERFDIDPYKKTCMMNGYDDIDYLVSKKEKIKIFEASRI